MAAKKYAKHPRRTEFNDKDCLRAWQKGRAAGLEEGYKNSRRELADAIIDALGLGEIFEPKHES